MEPQDFEGEQGDGLFQRGDEVALGNLLHADDDLPLEDGVDQVDVIDALVAVEVALMNGVDADPAWAVLGVWFAADADGDTDGLGSGEGLGDPAISGGSSEVVDVSWGNVFEAFKSLVAVDVILPLENAPGCRPGKALMGVVGLGQE